MKPELDSDTMASLERLRDWIDKAANSLAVVRAHQQHVQRALQEADDELERLREASS